MTHVLSVPDEVLAEVRRWRENATNLVLVALTGAGIAAGLCATLGSFVLPPSQLTVGLSVFGTLVVALFMRRRHYRRRATILLVSLYVLAIEQLAVNGLVGDGRIALLVLPLLALILLGATEGWIAASVTGTILAAFTLLAANGVPRSAKDIQEKSAHPGYWLLQVLLLLGALIPLMLLFSRFLAQQMRTMIAERQTRRELEGESATRRHLETEIMRMPRSTHRRRCRQSIQSRNSRTIARTGINVYAPGEETLTPPPARRRKAPVYLSMGAPWVRESGGPGTLRRRSAPTDDEPGNDYPYERSHHCLSSRR